MSAKTASRDITIETDLLTLIVPEDTIREAGWIQPGEEELDPCELNHCDDEDCECTDGEVALQVVELWHNEQHAGVFRFCDESPCKALRVEVVQ